MKYTDFVDLRHKPKETDIVCRFYVEPEDTTMKEAAGGVAAESSVGTWTELTTAKPYVKKLAATVFIDRSRKTKSSIATTKPIDAVVRKGNKVQSF